MILTIKHNLNVSWWNLLNWGEWNWNAVWTNNKSFRIIELVWMQNAQGIFLNGRFHHTWTDKLTQSHICFGTIKCALLKWVFEWESSLLPQKSALQFSSIKVHVSFVIGSIINQLCAVQSGMSRLPVIFQPKLHCRQWIISFSYN